MLDGYEKVLELLTEEVDQKQSVEFQKELLTVDCQRGMDIVNSDSEKIEIGLEVLADIKSMLKADFPKAEDMMVYFQRGERKKKGIVFLGEGRTRKETYRHYAEQVLDILVQDIPPFKESKDEKGKKQEEECTEEEKDEHYDVNQEDKIEEKRGKEDQVLTVYIPKTTKQRGKKGRNKRKVLKNMLSENEKAEDLTECKKNLCNKYMQQIYHGSN